jgi:hypothetical protein
VIITILIKRRKYFTEDNTLGAGTGSGGIMGKVYKSYENEVRTGARTKRAIRKGFNFLTGSDDT